MKKLLAVLFTALLLTGCGLLDSGEDEVIEEVIVPFSKINSIEFSEGNAIVTATVDLPQSNYSYKNTNVVLKDGQYFFDAKGLRYSSVGLTVVEPEEVSFTVKLYPYPEQAFNFRTYNNAYIDTVITPSN